MAAPQPTAALGTSRNNTNASTLHRACSRQHQEQVGAQLLQQQTHYSSVACCIRTLMSSAAATAAVGAPRQAATIYGLQARQHPAPLLPLCPYRRPHERVHYTLQRCNCAHACRHNSGGCDAPVTPNSRAALLPNTSSTNQWAQHITGQVTTQLR